jgi:hypothetical protein
MDDKKPHRRYGQSYSIAFWNGNVASDEDGATRATLEVGAPGMPYPTFEFRWPEQKYDMDRFEAALAKAFERGIYAAKKEIRDVLGINQRS